MSLSDVTATATNKGDISVLITGADGKRVQAEIQGMGTFSPGTDANGPSFGRAEVPMSDKLRIAFFGMMVGGAAFLSWGMAVYLAMAQVQDSAMQVAKLQDRIIQAQGSVQPTGKQYARFQPSQ
jgi:hypothetical protein